MWKPDISKIDVSAVGPSLLGLLVVQNTSATLLAKYTMTRYDYNVQNMLLCAEMIKLLSSLVLEAFTFEITDYPTSEKLDLKGTVGEKEIKKHVVDVLLQSFHINIISNPRDALTLTVPAGLYLLQNSLVYYSISLLPLPLFQVAQQTKLITTTILSVLFLKRSYTYVQWNSILLLCAGVALCVISSSHYSDETSTMSNRMIIDKKVKDVIFGLLLILLSNASSSAAGVYFEVVVKATKQGNSSERSLFTQPSPSIWMRNIQLSFFTICFLGMNMAVKSSQQAPKQKPFFFDFTCLVWIQIFIFALGGLLVASAIKHTDSVRKSLASGISMVVSSAISIKFIEEGSLSFSFVLGALFAVGGCFVFSNPDFFVRQIASSCRHPSAKNTSVAIGLALSFAVAAHSDVSAIVSGAQGSTNQKHFVGGLPHNFKAMMHVHVMAMKSRTITSCGGCMVLWELYDTITDMNVSTSVEYDHGPNFTERIDAVDEKIVVIVYPEGMRDPVEGPGKRVHVRWILAPLGKNKPLDVLDSWGADDLVFNYASSCSMRPDLVSPSNILQVITSPTDGDDTDISDKQFYSGINRSGVLWTMRKAKRWHDQRKIKPIHEKSGKHVRMERMRPQFTTPDFLKFVFFVSYDPYTFYSYKAAMMGTISVIYPLENTTKSDWARGTYVGEYLRDNGGEVPGIAYGWTSKEIEFANRTKSELRRFLFKVRSWGKNKTVPRLLRDAYRHGIGERENFESAMLVREAYNVSFWERQRSRLKAEGSSI